MQDAYFDNSNAAKPSVRVLEAMMPYLSERWYAPSAPYGAGQLLVSDRRRALSAICGALELSEQGNLLITSSGAEAVNQVVNSVYQEMTRRAGKNHYVVGGTDEAPAIMAVSRLESDDCTARMIPAISDGYVSAQALRESITPRTALVSLSWANGLTGVITPLREIASVCKERGILLHIDITHVIGKLFLDFGEVNPDYITFNGSQLHGPQGVGALYAREGAPLLPLIAGGAEQGGIRAGYPLLAQTVGLAEAVVEAQDTLDLMATETARLRDRLIDGIMSGFSGARLLLASSERLPHIAPLSFRGVSGEALLHAITHRGVFATIGGGNFQQLALNLVNAGIREEEANTAISFALSRYTTGSEVDQAVAVIIEEAIKLRKLSMEVV